MRFRFLLSGCFLLGVLFANAQVSSTFSNGLAGKPVKAISIESNGHKWFGTDEGLFRFDGIHWEKYGSGTFLPSSFVNDILIDEGNEQVTFWIATRG